MPVQEPITPYADLDRLLVRMLEDWRGVLGDDLAGAYLQGSFALGAGDRYSDCDWLVATHDPPTDGQVDRLRALHDELPTRGVPWCDELEGSYAPRSELASVEHLGRRWWFNDHGRRTLVADDHCNHAFTRWILREHGTTLWGPPPRSFMAPVPAEVMRHEAAASLLTLVTDLDTWLDVDGLAWGQRYAVATTCRILYTLDTAAVASKRGALEWGLRELDPRWRPLLGQVRDERSRGWEPERRPRPGEAEAARELMADAAARARRYQAGVG